MLRDFTWTEKYEEAMSDEHPRFFNMLGFPVIKEANCIVLKMHLNCFLRFSA